MKGEIPMKKILVTAVCSIAIAAISTSAVIAVSNSSNFDEATLNIGRGLQSLLSGAE